MWQFIGWLLISAILSVVTIICGLKTTDAWEKWQKGENAFIGNKTVIGNQMNLNTERIVSTANKIDVAKLKIKRAFEDFDKALDEITSNFHKESNNIANLFNLNGMLGNGEHIQKQIDLSINTKKELDRQSQDLQRKIENVLIGDLDKTSLQSAGNEFNEEQKLFDQAQSRCRALYPLLNDNPKSWEMKTQGRTNLTKDFDVANDQKN